MDLRIGSLVKGAKGENIEIVDFLGAGSFGLVFKGHADPDLYLAVKTITTASLGTDALRALQNEGHLAVGIQHENVLAVNFFHDGTVYPDLPPYLVSEFAEEGTLQDLIRGRSDSFPEDELLGLYRQLCAGMEAIHQRLVHRDVKPDNILIHRGSLKIADFGLSKIVGAATRPGSATLKGINAIRYCSPEAWLQETNAPSMDMYSMGVVFYELATLRHPLVISGGSDPVAAWRIAHMTQVPADPRTINPDISQQVAQTLLRMLQKRPADRYQTWAEVMVSLDKSAATTRGVDVQHLVDRVLARKQAEDAVQLEVERAREEERETVAKTEFAFGELMQDVSKVVDAFNDSSEFSKLLVQDVSRKERGLDEPFVAIIRSTANNSKGWDADSVSVEVMANVHGIHLPQPGREVMAAGVISTRTQRGLNLLRLKESADDLYGRWYVVRSRPNPLFNEEPSADPRAFNATELREQLPLLGALDRFQMRLEPWSSEIVTEVVGYIL